MKILSRLIGGELEAIRELPVEEYTTIQIHKKNLNDFSSNQQLHEMVKMNFEDYTLKINYYLNAYLEDSKMNWTRITKISMDLNRLILNFLSSFRTFLDHSEADIKRKNGENSSKYKRFKETCKNEYDQSFAYRFLYKLRNYAQHCGMPIGQIDFDSRIIDENQGEISYKMNIFFRKSELLEKYESWGKQVKEDLINETEMIEVNELMNQLIESVKRISLVLNAEDKIEILESIEYIENLIQPLIENNEKTPCIIEMIDMPDTKDRLKVEVEWFPLEFIKLIKGKEFNFA